MKTIILTTLALYLMISCGGSNGGGDPVGNNPIKKKSNYVIASGSDNDGGVLNAGSVRLMNGVTGAEISSISGDNTNDFLGNTRVTVLGNGNYVIASQNDDIGGISDVGSVRLINGSTGAEIAFISGDDSGDNLGSPSVTALSDGNYVIASSNDDVGGVRDVGSVRLVNGVTGAEIALISGNDAFDNLGSSSVTALSNGNYVIASAGDDVGTIVNAGSVRLINGSTGAEIALITGDDANDFLAGSSVTALNNGNFVIASSEDDVTGLVDAGSVRLVNGITGAEISLISGDSANDELGRSSVTALSNGNYVIASLFDDVGGVSDAGSVRLVNGSTGAEIALISGNNAVDILGSSSVTALSDGNYVIASAFDDVGTIVDAGSVRLVNGSTGAEIALISGDNTSDRLGESSVTALSNGNYIFTSQNDDVGGVTNAGSVRLVNGSTGVEIALTSGDDANDNLGSSSVTELSNGNYVIASESDDVGTIVNAGSVRLMNGITGVEIALISGDDASDFLGISSVTALSNGNYVIASRLDDVGGVSDAGSVRLVNGSTGAEIALISGDDASDFLGNSSVTEVLVD